MRIFSGAFAAIALATTIVTATKAVEFPDGRVSFEQSPRLVEATTTFKGVRVWGAKYYFTLELPADVGEPLKTVTIRQQPAADQIRFQVDETFAFVGTRNDRGNQLPLQATKINQEEGTVAVTFEEAIAPGTTLTIGLKPRQNPDYSGVYLFGVTAFPAGEKPLGLYLGSGRLHFYRGGDDNSI